MKSTYSVYGVLTSIYENRYSRSEVNYLIDLSYSYSYTYLKYRYKNLNKVLLAEDVNLQELAIDAIAPLFERDETGTFIKLSKAFNEWQPKIESDQQAAFFINRIVAKSVEKFAAELLRQSDPFFSKILDSINYLIEKHNYKKKNLIGATYIVESESEKKIGSLPDIKFINELPIELFENNNEILKQIFNYIKANTDSTPAIPLNALVMKIKQIKMSSFNLSQSATNGNEIEIESVVNKALEITFVKMYESYLSKNKIDENEADKFREAFRNIIIDLRDGGISPGLHKYLLEQMPELTFENYEKRYQNIFEYLFKILKKEIINQLNN
ncbi:MAG TPA: hypothetical protein DHV28_09000 [Ignavibacteriales bacterium]|nr:hypothetical protein [Ignavibacteriales bacterium]